MRESQSVRIAKLAYHIAQQTLPTYAHPKSRHDYTFPQRVACVMLKIYLNYTYRDLEEWLLATDQVRQALQLSRVPDHTTLYRTFAKLSQQQWQQQGRRAAAAPSSERNDRRCGHHRLSQRHGKCVLSEPSWGHAAFVGAGLWWVLRASGLWGCGWGADLVQTRSGSPRCGRRRVGMGYARGVWHDCGCWRTQGLMVGM
jgi:hypothetical protein